MSDRQQETTSTAHGNEVLDLSGRRVLITGGAGDLGVAVVRRLSDQGAVVVVNDVAEDPVARGRLRGCVESRTPYVRADVRHAAEVDRLLHDGEQAAGGLFDLVCCHAGIVDSHPVQEFPMESFDAIQALNVRGSYLVASAVSRRWRALGRPGSLIFTSSWVQDVPWPGIAPYAASKAAVRSLMRSFARELAPYGIRSNAVAPGIVGVGMAKRQWDSEPGYRSRAEKAIPLGALQTPESVADAFLFLASPLSAYMTGATLLVDGGCSLYPMD